MDVLSRQKGIAETWVRLEKYLAEFETEEEIKKRSKQKERPLQDTVSMSRPSTAIGHRSKDFSIRTGGMPLRYGNQRPMTAAGPHHQSRGMAGRVQSAMVGPIISRPCSSMNNPRGFSAANIHSYGKKINNLSLNQILALYEAKCADNDVDYKGIQAKYFVDKVAEKCKHREFVLIEQSLSLNSANIIKKLMEGNKHFIKFNLSKNLLRDEGACLLSEALKRDTQIIHLNLASNCLTRIGVGYLCEMLKTNKTLVSLNINSFEGLNRNKIGAHGVGPLRDMLKKNKTLMFLNLQSTQITLNGFKQLSDGLKFNKTLLGLDVSNNYFGPMFPNYLIQCLPKTQLEQLNISRCKLGDQGVSSMASVFSHLNANNILKLDLSGNKFTCKGLAQFLDGLKSNRVLETLDLSDNNFMSRQIGCIGGFLIDNQSIRTLTMNKCSLEWEAGESLKAGLARNKSLEYLYLKENNICDKGFEFMCEALTGNEVLRVLDMANNNIRDKGGLAFGKMLLHNKCLETVNLCSNTITDNSAPTIVEGVMANKTLRKIRLIMNPMSFKYSNEIDAVLVAHANQKNKNLQPKIESKIQLLKSFEQRKDEVIQKVEDLKLKLREDKRAFKELEKKIQGLEEIENLETQKYLDRYKEGMRESSAVEEKQYNLEISMKNFRKGMKGGVQEKIEEEQFLGEEIIRVQNETHRIKERMQAFSKESKNKQYELGIDTQQLKTEIRELEALINDNQELYDERTGVKKKGADLNLKLDSTKSKEVKIRIEDPNNTKGVLENEEEGGRKKKRKGRKGKSKSKGKTKAKGSKKRLKSGKKGGPPPKKGKD